MAYVSPQVPFKAGLDNIEMGGGVANAQAWTNGPDLQRLFTALREANVAVYQYDTRPPSADAIDTTFGAFADSTGGRFVTYREDPWAHVDDMFVENSSYYVLGYESVSVADGKYRALKVSVDRPGVSVRAADGYQAPTARAVKKAAEAKPKAAIDQALTSVLPANEFPMTLSAAPFAVPGQKTAAVAITAGLDRDASLPAKDQVNIAVRAYSVDAARKSQGVATATLELSHQSIGAGTVHYDVPARLNLAPGRYELRLAVESPANHMTGSAFVSVTIPDYLKEPLSLSGVVVSRLPPRKAVGKDSLDGLLPLTTTTQRHFARSDRAGALIRVYQGGKLAPVPVTLTTRVVDIHDRVRSYNAIVVPPETFTAAAREAEYRFELPLTVLEPGEYLLTMAATADAHTERRDVRFSVR
jgi:hypothetical protein